MNYRDYNDNELLYYVSENNEDAEALLYKKYEPIIVNFSNKVFPYVKTSGLEINDLIQEGMLGLNQAMKYYDEEKESSFYTFAKTCIERKILSMVVSAKRLKHKILNESLSIETSDDEQSISMEFLLKDTSSNPETVLLSKEREEKLIQETKKALTDFEDAVFTLRTNNFSYQEIATILDKDKKAVDNALQRIRFKMRQILKEL
ncbi:MAG: sigma-70 family RNA polymerase sigma factor [Firmicutes bacterium]|nr:sigma-70 family RNA polymerase sigma factor [Bacillota bacterium]